jgi:hypothetical protein
MAKPITDRAEVSVDFPEKAYYGSFGRQSSFDVHTDELGVHIDLDRRSGEKRHIGLHVHYYLLADLLTAIAEGLKEAKMPDETHAPPLRKGAEALLKALDHRAKGKRGRG